MLCSNCMIKLDFLRKGTRKKMKNTKATRRGFLKSSALFGMAGAAPMFIPSGVFGQNAPSNKLVVGIIGMGWRGIQLMEGAMRNDNIEIAAISDFSCMVSKF